MGIEKRGKKCKKYIESKHYCKKTFEFCLKKILEGRLLSQQTEWKVNIRKEGQGEMNVTEHAFVELHLQYGNCGKMLYGMTMKKKKMRMNAYKEWLLKKWEWEKDSMYYENQGKKMQRL